MNKWIALIAIFSVFFTGCNNTKKPKRPVSQEIRLNLFTEPPNIDPRKAMDTTSLKIINLCFEGLTRPDKDGQIVLAAAEKVEISSDKKKYTFTLRDAKWSDGKPVFAQDFEKTWKILLDPDFPCEFANDLYIIKNAKEAKTKLCSINEIGVSALDDKTLVIDLAHPVPYFLEVLSTHSFFAIPRHLSAKNLDWTIDNYVGNGPFAMKEWKSHDHILLEKNSQYWDKENPKLERIYFMMVEDSATELAMYEQGELDWIGSPLSNLASEALSSLKSNPDLHTYKISAFYYFIFNIQEFPFQNVNMRKAFALAINREAIVSNITQMGQSIATGMIPPTMWNETIIYFNDNDEKEAKRLFELGLKELGITAKQLPSIVLSYNTAAVHHKIAQVIQEQWTRLFGIDIQLENKEWKVHLSDLRQQKFQIARMGAVAKFNDPISLLDYYRYPTNAMNFSQWTSPEFTRLLDASDEEDDPLKRMLLLKKAEKIFMEEMPIAPIYFFCEKYLKKPYVKGIFLNELNRLDLKWAYIEVND